VGEAEEIVCLAVAFALALYAAVCSGASLAQAIRDMYGYTDDEDEETEK
jgi:hypothetical protein